MAISQQQLVCDSSTLANFKQWAQAISSFFTTAGWLQSGDTGQVNWSTIASVPGTNAFVYEVWEPNDGLTNFYVKVEYGNGTVGSNRPLVRVSIGTSTNGAGTLTGYVIGPYNIGQGGGLAPPSAVTQYDCHFSGVAGRMGMMMWRNTGTNDAPFFFGIERSVNSSGAYTSSHVTLIGVGWSGNGGAWMNYFQKSLVFGIEPSLSPAEGPIGLSNNSQTFAARMFTFNTSSAFNNGIPFDTIAPAVGFFDYPLTVAGIGSYPDFVEAVTFTVTLYGVTRTYLPSKVGPFQLTGPASSAVSFAMRYD